MQNIPAKFHLDNKKNNNMSSDIRSVPDLKSIL